MAAEHVMPHQILGKPLIAATRIGLHSDRTCCLDVRFKKQAESRSVVSTTLVFPFPGLASKDHSTRHAVHISLGAAQTWDQNLDGRSALREIRHHRRTRSRSSTA